MRQYLSGCENLGVVGRVALELENRAVRCGGIASSIARAGRVGGTYLRCAYCSGRRSGCECEYSVTNSNHLVRLCREYALAVGGFAHNQGQAVFIGLGTDVGQWGRRICCARSMEPVYMYMVVTTDAICTSSFFIVEVTRFLVSACLVGRHSLRVSSLT